VKDFEEKTRRGIAHEEVNYQEKSLSASRWAAPQRDSPEHTAHRLHTAAPDSTQESSTSREKPTSLHGHSCKATWFLQAVSVTAHGPMVCQKPVSLEREAHKHREGSSRQDQMNASREP
jgi:hypothetical protein